MTKSRQAVNMMMILVRAVYILYDNSTLLVVGSLKDYSTD